MKSRTLDARVVCQSVIARKPILAWAIVLWATVVSPGQEPSSWPHERRLWPFVVHADFPLDRLDSLLHELVALQQEIHRRLALQASTECIDVYLFAAQDTYYGYLRRHFPDIQPRQAMFIKSNSPGNVFAQAGPNLAIDLRHETTHAVLHAALPLVPLWLDEGLAEYFEVPLAEGPYDHPHQRATRRGLMWGKPPSLQRLEALQELSQMGAREYQESWAWVHFLLHGPPTAQAALSGYIRDVERGIPPRPISERLHGSMPQPEKELVRHFKSWRR